MQNLDSEKILSGDRRQLAKAFTFLESSRSDHKKEARELLQEVLKKSKSSSIKIGVSGTPGVGKSTFIECLGAHVLKDQKKLAVLAVDPSSPISGGSILGDKTRMVELSKDNNCFIRPTPSRGHLGGVSTSTYESALLCEAAGFDVILIETVGVGQSEFEVANMVDLFFVLIEPLGGDELQGIKKGIMEVANYIVVNKAEKDNKKRAEATAQEYKNAIHIKGEDESLKAVHAVSSLEDVGVSELWSEVCSLYTNKTKKHLIDEKKQLQQLNWLETFVSQRIVEEMKSNEILKKELQSQKDQILKGKTNLFEATEHLVSKITSNS